MDSIVIVEDSKSFGAMLQNNVAKNLEQEVFWVKNYDMLILKEINLEINQEPPKHPKSNTKW